MNIENLKAVIHNNGHSKMVNVELFSLTNPKTYQTGDKISFQFHRTHISLPVKYFSGNLNSNTLDYVVASYFYMAYRDSLKEVINNCFFTNGNGMSSFHGFFSHQSYIPGPIADIIKKDLETYGKI